MTSARRDGIERQAAADGRTARLVALSIATAASGLLAAASVYQGIETPEPYVMRFFWFVVFATGLIVELRRRG